MTTYETLENGSLRGNGYESIPEGHPLHRAALQQVEDGKAEILPYVAPVKPARQVRDEALDAMVHDFGDGRVIQVRPQDEPNFERAYRIFALTNAPTIDWVMVDNVKHAVTEAELRTAQDAGILEGAAIWAAYDPEA